MSYDAKPLEATIHIDAPPATVWALVSDLPRMAEWSPQVVRSTVQGGGPVQLGSRLTNLNKRGLLRWPTKAKVVAFEPEQKIAFRVADNWMHWSYTLSPSADGGTDLAHRRDAPEGLSPISAISTKLVMGGDERFTAHILDGMKQTLARIKAEAEA